MLQKGQFFIECPGQPTVLEMLLQDPVLAAALSAKRARIERATNPRTVGAQVEARVRARVRVRVRVRV